LASNDSSAPSHNSAVRVTYAELMNHSVHTKDDIDIGDIFAINRQFIVVVRGFLNVHYYYVPINNAEGWDGNVLWLNISEEEAKIKYERNRYPDGSRYFVKDDFPEPVIINSKSRRLVLKKNNDEGIVTGDYHFSTPINSVSNESNSLLNKCDLCNVFLKTEDELNNHVFENH
jgi:hypothetical protein